MSVGLEEFKSDAGPEMGREGSDEFGDTIAANDRSTCRAHGATAVGVRDHVSREESFECGDVTISGRSNERFEETVLLGETGGSAASFSDVLASPGYKLTRVGFFYPNDFSNLAVRIIEGFAQHIGGALGGREFFEQNEDC